MKDDKIIEMFREIAIEESKYAPSFTVDCLLEAKIIMKNGHNIIIFCGERALVDCSGISPDGHFGIDNTMIWPIEDIEDIQLKMRWTHG